MDVLLTNYLTAAKDEVQARQVAVRCPPSTSFLRFFIQSVSAICLKGEHGKLLHSCGLQAAYVSVHA